MTALWQKAILAASLAAVVAAVVYATQYDSSPPRRSPSPPPVPGDAGVVAPDAAPGELRARVTVGGSWIDLTVHGAPEAARTLCEALVADELRRGVADVKPVVARPCAAQELPAAPGPAGVWLIDTHSFDGDLLLGVARVPGASVTIERVSSFPTTARCEEIRKRLAAGAGSDQTAANALAKELEQAKRTRDRDCQAGSATHSSCDKSKTLVEILERASARQSTAAPPASTGPICAERK
ncbi:MAG: hypothetical protein ABI867_22080 [Kofleriaceae bacterium]